MRHLVPRKYGGLALVIAGEATIVLHVPDISNFYFPIVWFGYIIALDGFSGDKTGASLWRTSKTLFLVMIPISAGFWWLFEAFNLGVHSWHYVGSNFTPVGFVLYASVCFSTVLLAVWETAACIGRGVSPESQTRAFFAPLMRNRRLENDLPTNSATRIGHGVSAKQIQLLMIGSVLLGVAFIILPVLFPLYAFPLIWGALFFLLDPANYWLGRPSLIYEVLHGRFNTALTFAFAALICGFLWEGWNYWSTVKWVYHVPFVSQVHLFEMPLPGYLGYLPFGLEVYAATVFTVPTVMASGRWLGRLARSEPPALEWTVKGQDMARSEPRPRLSPQRESATHQS